jgi:hypothetical protein
MKETFFDNLRELEIHILYSVGLNSRYIIKDNILGDTWTIRSDKIFCDYNGSCLEFDRIRVCSGGYFHLRHPDSNEEVPFKVLKISFHPLQ